MKFESNKNVSFYLSVMLEPTGRIFYLAIPTEQRLLQKQRLLFTTKISVAVVSYFALSSPIETKHVQS